MQQSDDFSQSTGVSYAVTNANRAYKTTDGGINLGNSSGTTANNLPSLQVNTESYPPSNSNWIYIGTDPGVFATDDRNINWCIAPNYTDN